jgi:hypothetical protein
LVYALQPNDRLQHFAVSNLGNIEFCDGTPFRPIDLRLYVHSFKTRVLGWFTYTFDGEMRFYCVSNDNCMSCGQVDALKREFMAVLQCQAIESASLAHFFNAGPFPPNQQSLRSTE